MKKIITLLLISLLSLGCSVGNSSIGLNTKSEEDIRNEYSKLQEDIEKLITFENGKVHFEYEEVKTLVNEFDVVSANLHLGGEWTHETLLDSIVKNIQEMENKP